MGRVTEAGFDEGTRLTIRFRVSEAFERFLPHIRLLVLLSHQGFLLFILLPSLPLPYLSCLHSFLLFLISCLIASLYRRAENTDMLSQ